MTSRLSTISLFVLLCHVSLGAPAEGADFTGAWTTDASACNKVFVKSGGRISFTKDSELTSGGLIFQGKEVQGTGSTCRIKTTKEDGEVTHMILADVDDVASLRDHGPRVRDNHHAVRRAIQCQESECR